MGLKLPTRVATNLADQGRTTRLRQNGYAVRDDPETIRFQKELALRVNLDQFDRDTEIDGIPIHFDRNFMKKNNDYDFQD